MISQSEFHSALRDAARPIPEGLQDKGVAPAGKRFDVYRNNVAVSLSEALREGFPATARLLGEANFTQIARQFVACHAPRSPLMYLYGDSFPEFLAGIAPLAHLPWLSDVARLEWGMRCAYHAADAAPIATETLQSLTPEEFMTARFQFAPAVQLHRYDYPVASIRAYALNGGAQPQGAAEAVLITRAEFDPALTVLPPAQADLLQALLNGQPLGDALEPAPDADLSALLPLLLQHGALHSLQ
ncbi:DNA-binding domain-containing protein [Thalassovita sp.]|uniref:HvfC/BufC N-terminal domain-containing protein n=1 Tax=Thalassovita sp. TaxID=1979401 RepID=UPI0028812067|nr:DNA-binding domain-containing protein [Thalassovita sp.]MDF1801862.1 DNA-binding domain-containing protein [Thalassovita sp.]